MSFCFSLDARPFNDRLVHETKPGCPFYVLCSKGNAPVSGPLKSPSGPTYPEPLFLIICRFSKKPASLKVAKKELTFSIISILISLKPRRSLTCFRIFCGSWKMFRIEVKNFDQRNWKKGIWNKEIEIKKLYDFKTFLLEGSIWI